MQRHLISRRTLRVYRARRRRHGKPWQQL